MSTILGIICIASLGIVLYLTYLHDGEATVGYGVTGLLATIFSAVGLVLGILTVRVREYYRLFPCLGIVLNLIVLGSISFMLYFGSTI